MLVGIIASTVNHAPFFCENAFLGDVSVVRVQVSGILSDHVTREVVPGPATDAIPCVHGALSTTGLSTQVRAPYCVTEAPCIS